MTRFLLSILLLIPILGTSQDFYFPTAAELSHPELIIKKVSISDKNTVIELSVTNSIMGGWFCADKNIYLINKADNKKYNLKGSKNIPNCPDKHSFSKIGEKLEFTLYFDKIENIGERIDLIENCDNSCFFFKDILLDNKKNSDIHLFEAAVVQFENGNINQAASNFEKIISDIPDEPTHVYGFTYSYLYKIALIEGDQHKANTWKEKFLNSKLPNKDYYLNNFKL
ncbi:MAG: hypothetical protein ABFR62_07660 [Bacteroidota bacterium]